MLIGVCGSICAGKSTVARYLVERHGFTRLSIRPDDETEAIQAETMQAGTAQAVTASVATSTTIPVFASAEELLDFVTLHWRDRWVTTDVVSEAVLDVFSRRPFFLLISVDAPLAVRWRRAQARDARRSGKSSSENNSPSLEEFVALSDRELYGGGGPAYPPLLPVMARSEMRLVNGGPGGFLEVEATAGQRDGEAKVWSKVSALSPTALLYNALDKAGLTAAGAEQLLRPSWDRYFMALASLAALRSNCMKRRVGCVLVRERRVVSTGYNGTPRGLRNCGDGGCGRCNGGLGSGHGLATCLCLHAEENALLEAGRERIPSSAAAETTLYCNTCPCLTCSIKIAQVGGIGEVVYSQGYSMDAETAAVFREAGVRLRQYVPPAQGMIHLEKIVLP